MANELEKTHQQFMDKLDASMEETKRVLELNGIRYDLSQWVSVSEYAKRFGIENSSTVSSAISRGYVPAENVIEIPEFKMRLIKAVPYK